MQLRAGFIGRGLIEEVVLGDGNYKCLDFGDCTYRKCNPRLTMNSDDADPSVEKPVSGTPRDYSEGLYGLYLELIDVDGTAERILRNFLGPLHAKQVRRLEFGFRFVAPIQCVPDLLRLLTRENIAVYQLVRQEKVEGKWR